MTTENIKDTEVVFSTDVGSTPVDLKAFSKLVGFPVNFIKEELLVDTESMSLSELRNSVLTYLHDTMKE